MFRKDRMVVSVKLVAEPFDQTTIENYASTNFFWEDAMDVAVNHKVYLAVVVLPTDKGAVDASILDSQVNASTLSLDNAIGISVVGTVYDPILYRDAAYRIKENVYPVLTQVYIRVYYNERDELSAYTYGLDHFGKLEIEVIDSVLDPMELFNAIRDIFTELITLGVNFSEGERVDLVDGRIIQANISPSPIFGHNTTKIKYLN